MDLQKDKKRAKISQKILQSLTLFKIWVSETAAIVTTLKSVTVLFKMQF